MLRQASRRLAQLYDAALAPAGLKSSQFTILSELMQRRPVLPAVSELAASLVMDRSTLGQNLRPLQRDGYVTLLAHPGDGRVRAVGLTAAGVAKYRQARPHWRRAQDRFERVFGAAQAQRLHALLRSVAQDPRLAPGAAGR